ncbi:OmpA family protein [Escherichia coli]|nr:OmpA family protein [Escherichia coli]
MLPSEIMIWQPEFTDKILSRKPGAVHTDNYGEDSYNEGLSLKRANVVADAWAMGGQIPRSNLTTQGLGKKYPIASNKTAQGRAENRRVAVVITTP